MLVFKQHQQNQEAINKFGFQCIDVLNEYVVKNESRESPNLFKIFFHELVCFFTSTYISQITNLNDTEKTELPFVNSSFIKEHKMHFWRDKTRNSPSRLLRFFLFINFWSKKKVWIGSTLRKEEKKLLIKYAFKFKIRFSIKNQIIIKEYEVKEFYRLINQVNKELNLSLTQNHLDCLFTYFNQFFNTSNIAFDKKGILLTGTTTKIQSRINAANFIKYKQKVYSFGHGYSSIKLFEEPVFEYGEQWCCSTFIDYGQVELKKTKNSPKIINRSSERVQTLRNIGTHKLVEEKFLYVPTSLSSYQTYAPFRNFYDAYYIAWQKQLLDYLSKSNMNFKLKAHPKCILNYDFISKELIEKKSMDQCFIEYDGFIFDYVSTALIETLATENKVFFFDIDNRKIAKEALSKLRQDVNYIKIDFNQDLNKQIGQNFYGIKPKRFSFIDTYSNSKTSTKQVINKILKDYSME